MEDPSQFTKGKTTYVCFYKESRKFPRMCLVSCLVKEVQLLYTVGFRFHLIKIIFRL